MTKTIHWVCPAPSPYHSYFFRALAADPDVDLVVHYVQRTYVQHPWKTQELEGFTWRVFSPFLGVDWTMVRLALTRRQDFIMLAGWDTATTQLVAATSLAPFALWTDTPNESRRRGPFKALVRRLSLRWFFAHARAVLGTGQPALRQLRALGAPAQKLVNFPFFVREGARREPSGGDASGTRVIEFCSLGRLDNSLKGFDIALEALARARDMTGHDNFRYRIAGVGPDESLLRDQASRLRLADQVEFVGWLEAADTARLLQESDVLLHPARRDPFPVVVLESMAAGLVVLGSDVSGSVSDRVRHGHNGFVHTVGDVDTLANQIAAILREPEQLVAIGERARETAAEWPVSRGVNIIKELVGGLR